MELVVLVLLVLLIPSSILRESVAGSEFERVQESVINFAHPRVGSEKFVTG